MKPLTFALALVCLCGFPAQGEESSIVPPECKNMPIGRMTREQVINCETLEKMVSGMTRLLEQVDRERPPPDAVRVMRGNRETLEIPATRR